MSKRLDKLVAKLDVSVGMYSIRLEFLHTTHSMTIRTTIIISEIINKMAQIGFCFQSFSVTKMRKSITLINLVFILCMVSIINKSFCFDVILYKFN